MATGCCGCCSALRPRYKRLVDNIFPVNPHDGLVKSNMEKLIFYSLSSPEKLDRIGEYLFQKASRDIYRKRNGLVIIAMEAMDQLLVACHAQTLNLFVVSFLKMVQKLLESADPQLQILSTQSFVRFANIEEDTPSYHRRYDFFVSKFSAMCHSNHGDKSTRDSIRLAGIKGIQGVVRKTVADDLVENIWEAQHMDKIVPSLLYNMQNCQYDTTKEGANVGEAVGSAQASTPPALAEACLRELVGRASFGHIKSVLRPVLRHFDLHKLWVPNDFAIHTFRIIMFSIQAQYSYTVVEILMTHLDDEQKISDQAISTLNVTNRPGAGGGDSTRIRTAVAEVLAKIIAIAAGESVGPSVLEIINSLLTHLRSSVTRDSENETDEKQYQEALINGLGEFANHLPDYQKIDIMMFIMSKVPFQPAGLSKQQKAKKGDIMLQSILLKSLLKVGSKYKTTQLSKAFPVSFLEPLLKMAGAPGPETRILVQRILHQLIDRRQNLDRLSIMSVHVADLELNLEKSSRPDLIFITKHGPAIYSSLFEGLQIENNTAENIEAIYTTLALLCVELASEETVSDMLQFVLGVQQLALTNPALSRTRRYQLHALAVALLALVPHAVALPSLDDYAKKIIEARMNDASHLLPSLSDEYDECVSPSKMPYLMIDQIALCECLKSCGIDASRLQNACPYTGGTGIHHLSHHRHSWVDAGAHGRDSIADLSTNLNTDVDSVSSSPGVQRQKPPPSELTFECMRRVLAENNDAHSKEKEEHARVLAQTFRTAPFSELQTMTQPKHDLQNKLTEIFNSLDSEPNTLPRQDSISSPSENALTRGGSCHKSYRAHQQNVPAYEKYFPEMFLY
ncbi:protein EFR3 homolog stmA [Arctopsyche grandis]|uniref:protein EFR3 homolog stmA n=1 Tax=Arctopsyche grandis TaxID=121162 RepID=UPI00406D65CB